MCIARFIVSRQHLMQPMMTIGKILGVLWVLGSGNLLLAGLAYWQYAALLSHIVCDFVGKGDAHSRYFSTIREPVFPISLKP